MFKAIQRMVWESLASVVALIASTGVAPASTVSYYQPEVPEELRK